ncbi:hypothetical protein PCASD_07987 [Puccinia coronata f. sp. avenae]|uniref:Uncharacterized protein n=1 Tax=Puccinia coronata f. sp. avenae TaxID=200324 RepID=A0A2N5UNU5_9BASI|nr:hypothetical protein PCASD_07987 [Puccinia coronata f. sp. avenae]
MEVIPKWWSMFRRSRIPLNSTDPSILQDVLERQSSLHLQPSLTNSYFATNSLKFMIAPGGQSFSIEEPLSAKPQPRLKSLIKLEHLLRPSPSFRLGGPRRVASAPSQVAHPSMASEVVRGDEPQLKPFSTGWRTQSTPRNPIVSIEGLKTRFSAQVSDTEYFSDDGDSTSESMSSESSPEYRRLNYTTTPSSSSHSSSCDSLNSSLVPSCIPSSDRYNYTRIQDSNLPKKATTPAVSTKPSVKFSRQVSRTIPFNDATTHPQQTSPLSRNNSYPMTRVDTGVSPTSHSPATDCSSPRANLPLNHSTDSHPRRKVSRVPPTQTPQINADEAETREYSIKAKDNSVGVITSSPTRATKQSVESGAHEELAIKSALHSPPSPRKQNLASHEFSRASSRKKMSQTSVSARASGRPQSLTKGNFPSNLPSCVLDAGPVKPYERERNIEKNVQVQERWKDSDAEVVEPINTKGLSSFIRPIKYGILQLSSSSRNPVQDQLSTQDDGRLHVRLWIKNQALLEPIPANLIVISPNGGKIELFHTALQVDEDSPVEELTRSFECAQRRVLFYSLEALPIQIRVIYNYLRKFLMIMLGGVPRAVFQLHTLKFQQRVRCAIMMNGPQPDMEFEWYDEKLKIKLSRDRARIRVWIKDQVVYHESLESSLFDHNLSDYLVKLLRDIFESNQKNEDSQIHHHGHQANHHLKMDRFQDLLEFIHPCLTISHQIEKSLDQF